MDFAIPLLWDKDIFWDSKNDFGVTSQKNISAIRALLTQRYSSNSNKPLRIRQSVAFEVNSSNFRLDYSDHTVLIKKIDIRNRNLAHLNGQLDIARRLNLAGLRLPEIYRADNGEILIEDDNCAWYIMEFVHGNYISANERDVGQASRLLDEVFCHLSRIGECDLPTMSLLGNSRLDVLDNLVMDREIIRQLKFILDEIISEQDSINTPQGLCHIDFHPRNVIIDDRCSAYLIDFDSFMIASRKSMFSFGLLKLVRHAMSGHGKFVPNVRDKIWAGISSENRGLISKRGAQAEVFRRLLSILDNTSPGNNKIWERLIPVHVRCLLEAEEIFNHYE